MTVNRKHYNKIRKRFKVIQNRRHFVIAVCLFLLVAGLGLQFLIVSKAATFAVASEAESGALTGNASRYDDTNASNLNAVRFGASTATRSTNCTPATSATMTNTVSHLCGFPDTTNSGATGSLTNVPNTITSPNANTGSGWTYNSSQQSIIADTDGAVIKNITSTVAEIVIQANNVTVDNVNIKVNDKDGFGVWIRGPNNTGAQNITIENSTISGGNNTSGRLTAGIKDIYESSTNTKILNNNIIFTSTGVQMDAGLIQGNYIHDMGFISGDHINGTTSNASDGTLLTIKNNTILNSFSQTDAISLFEDFGVQKNRVITGNLVAGGGYCMYGGQNAGGQAASNIQITNNHFSRMYFQNCGGQGSGIVAAWPLNGSGGVWSGNVWDDTGAAVNP
ncbi:MAG TPA: hypothetical protein VLG47_04320 [Candidatus Saccharimonadales bacterium]|nr:hypothetical protein [Candidatus Saccharimonadales bacterium]